jgi:hypothetical protein
MGGVYRNIVSKLSPCFDFLEDFYEDIGTPQENFENAVEKMANHPAMIAFIE